MKNIFWIIKLSIILIFEFILLSGFLHFIFNCTREQSIGYAFLILSFLFTFVLGALFEWRFSFVKWKKEFKEWELESAPIIEPVINDKNEFWDKHEPTAFWCKCVECNKQREELIKYCPDCKNDGYAVPLTNLENGFYECPECNYNNIPKNEI